MTPETLVPERETCLRMKELGFPQDTYFGWDRYSTEPIYGVAPRNSFAIAAAPTLAEILEQLPDHGIVEVWHGAGGKLHSCAYANVNSVGETFEVRHDNPAEAAARLWIKVRRTGGRAMTNWLDAAEVRAEAKRRRDEWNNAYPSRHNTYDDEDSKDEWWGPVKDQDKAGMSWNVLEAIAALPEPPVASLPQAPGCGCGICTLHRIWTIAHIVCGKEGR